VTRALLAALLLVSTTGPAAAESAGGVSWTAPTSWKAQPPRPMRVATYEIAAIAPDTDAAELAIFYFGEGQGGNAEDNIKRWAGQFSDAKPPVAKKQKIHGLDVTRVELDGTYAASMGPMGPMAQKVEKPGYHLLGAIVEGGQGAVFFKLVGPKKTVESARKKLDQLLSTLSK
jgi:hypothetical protein